MRGISSAARRPVMRHSDCPTERQLAAYHLGDLAEADLETIADHLETCPDCEATLQSLEGLADAALAALRFPHPDTGAAPAGSARLPVGSRETGEEARR